MPGSSKNYWDEAARENAAWHIATGHRDESEEFFESGRFEVDEYLRLAGVNLNSNSRLLEIGCGVGRMTHRLAVLAGTVIASDVSGEMLTRARANLSDQDNIRYLEVTGSGELPLADEEVTAAMRAGPARNLRRISGTSTSRPGLVLLGDDVGRDDRSTKPAVPSDRNRFTQR